MQDHEATGEANLHTLTDDEYFQNLHDNPIPVFDANGNELVGLYDDVIDARAQKAGGLL